MQGYWTTSLVNGSFQVKLHKLDKITYFYVNYFVCWLTHLQPLKFSSILFPFGCFLYKRIWEFKFYLNITFIFLLLNWCHTMWRNAIVVKLNTICMGCFILKTDQLLSRFCVCKLTQPPSNIVFAHIFCKVDRTAASGTLLNSAMVVPGGNTSIVYNCRDQLRWPHWRQNATQTRLVETRGYFV